MFLLSNMLMSKFNKRIHVFQEEENTGKQVNPTAFLRAKNGPEVDQSSDEGTS
jgi:hypothetical protein